MPATFARCNKCQYRFQFDYDYRQSRCAKCMTPFDWQGNPTELSSLRGDAGPPSGGGTAPILPGEPGYAEYADAARREHAATSLPYGSESEPKDISTEKDRTR
jgi:hypothetical protein